MKNFKSVIAALVIMTVVLICPAYGMKAAELTPAEKLNILGILIGPGTDVTPEYLGKPATRIDSAILMLKLMGLIGEAEGYTGEANFLDFGEALSLYSKTVMGYLKSNPSLGYVGYLDKFDPNAPVTDQMFYKVLLTLLGYRQDDDFRWNETNVMARLAGMEEIAGRGELVIGDLAAAIVEALGCEVKDTGILLAEQLVLNGVLDIDDVHAAGWDYIVID